VALVAGRVLALVARGVVLGIVAGFWCTHLLRGLIFGLPPHDWMSFGVASLVLLVISATAATIPAVRAATVDPSIALRDN
jgi:putative ABC transport system permease protein